MDLERLTYMANQIARNLAPQGEAAVDLTYQHLKDFWDPRMKAAILGSDRAGLDPIARAAVDRLAACTLRPPRQTTCARTTAPG